ncbi:hypothetical protein QBC38DRAFT_365049 [Podospora fimiseda]|uniref:Ubiquitin-like domain-containing protein n=1 Tax=Podospora fimiseda TaxID=252190 RepID=A0AAN7BPD0_9PEZI|nr:hypothetical protein QBC38DRAFT_365049 [Podospora fimiseda]
MADTQPVPLEDEGHAQGHASTVNLQILSPSPHVEPMRFPDMPVGTTVGELKEQIRERIASRPSNAQLRLIYQARFISRETDTLLDVFGEEVVSRARRLPPIPLPQYYNDELTTAAENAIRQAHANAFRNQPEYYRRIAQNVGTAAQVHNAPNGTHAATVNKLEVPPPVHQASSSDIVISAYPSGQLPLPLAGTLRATQTTTNAMNRNASGASTATMANNIANAVDWERPEPGQARATTPTVHGIHTRSHTPDFAPPPRSVAEQPQPRTQPRGQFRNRRPQRQAEVYIVRSPVGPHSLLVSQASEMYPLLVSGAPAPQAPAHSQPQVQPQQIQPVVEANRRANNVFFPLQAGAPAVAAAVPAQAQQPVQAQVQRPAQQPAPVPAPAAAPAPAAGAPAAVPGVFGHPGNPAVGGLGVFLALWPHVWLFVRLVMFAWWFSYSDPSWERWLSVAVGLTAIVLIHSGILNGIIDGAFNPVREQLEGMLPAPENNRRWGFRGAQNQQDQGGNDNNRQGNPDPARTARRLVAQRRIRNGTWLREQFEWIERAGVLLIASLAPGVAERHIQRLAAHEAAARAAEAERERLAQEAAAQMPPIPEGNEENGDEADWEDVDQAEQERENGEQNDDNHAQNEPLMVTGYREEQLQPQPQIPQQQQQQRPMGVA